MGLRMVGGENDGAEECNMTNSRIDEFSDFGGMFPVCNFQSISGSLISAKEIGSEALTFSLSYVHWLLRSKVIIRMAIL